MKKLQFFFLVALTVLFVSCAVESNEKISVSSPDGVNKIEFVLEKGVPKYTVNHGEKAVVNPSKLGFIFNGGDNFDAGFKVLESKTTTIDETWE